MPITLQQRPIVSVGSTRLVRINCTYDLDDGNLLTGTPTIAEVTTTALTLGNKAVNTAAYTDSVTGATVAIGKGIEFTATGGVAGTTYRIRVTCSTDGGPAETLVYDVLLTYQ